ncbi:MAG: methyltransferase [Phycisphaerales bacterium]|nr:MAG: methyltransferase [Phycisphaerales bacterium]
MSTANKPLRFISEFVRHPVATAAIAPSSRHLASAMCEGIDFTAVRTIFEFGPGTGVFTHAVLERLKAAGTTEFRYTALELNERMAAELREKTPRADVRHANALDIESICTREQLPPVDLVVSGLGWPSLPGHVRDGILEQTARVLRPGAEFRTFGYHVGLLFPGAWKFRAKCRELFSIFEISPVTWRNLPPAFVYRCVK